MLNRGRLVGLVLLVAVLAEGCAAPARVRRGPSSGIVATGQGRVMVRPDLALATVGVEARAPRLEDATAEVTRRMTAMLARVRGLGVDGNDIATVAYSIDPVPVPRRSEEDPARIAGYRVVNLVQLKIRDLEAVGRILDAAVAAGANSISSLQFTVDDRARHETEARALAVQAAAERARQLAATAGVRLGPLVSLSEAGPRPVERFARSAPMAVAAGPIEAGQLEVSVVVEAQYAIAR